MYMRPQRTMAEWKCALGIPSSFLRGVVAVCPNTYVIIDDEPKKLVEAIPLSSVRVP
jgi:hypothetical protein